MQLRADLKLVCGGLLWHWQKLAFVLCRSGKYSKWVRPKNSKKLMLTKTKERCAKIDLQRLWQLRFESFATHTVSISLTPINMLTGCLPFVALIGFFSTWLILKSHFQAFFVEGQYYRAAGQYRRALLYFDYMFTDTKEEEEKMRKVRVFWVFFSSAHLVTSHDTD